MHEHKSRNKILYVYNSYLTTKQSDLKTISYEEK